MNVDGIRCWPDLRSRPLCANYLAVHLTEQSTIADGLGGSETVTIQWALGVLNDGQSEVLGWWMDPADNAVDWSTIRADLSARGVERVRILPASAHLCNRESAPRSEDCRPVTGPLRPSASIDSLPARLRRHVEHASGLAGGFKAALSRAIARRGTFECAQAACSFVDEELQRMDRRLWPSRTVVRSRAGRSKQSAPASQRLRI
jgi:Transposase, Mutator family